MRHPSQGLLPAMQALALLSGLGACGAQQEQYAMPPPLVEVEAVRSQAVPHIVELPGRVVAIRTAEVRARIDGIVERRLYREGEAIAAGAPLFHIDPQDVNARTAEAAATLSRAEAVRVNARRLIERYGTLVSDNPVSASSFDEARAAAGQADAAVSEARARLIRARLEQGYALVRAPIAGRAGIAMVTEGALASAASATLLTTIEQISNVYVLFAPAHEEEVALDEGRAADAPVRLIRDDGSAYAQAGRLDFTSPTIDQNTGSQLYRAIFPNPRGQLLPGQFVRVRFERGRQLSAIVIPARAVQIGENSAVVFVLGAGDKLAARTVELGPQSGETWVIKSGLKVGERIVVAGWQNARAGQAVRIKNAKVAVLAQSKGR